MMLTFWKGVARSGGSERQFIVTGHAQVAATDVSRVFVALLWVPLFVALLLFATILLIT
jgi:hypothetical protein